MKWLRSIVLMVLAGGAAWGWTLYRRRQIVYPAALSFVLQSELANDSFETYQRVPTLQGGVNFRDIGGYLTEDGKRVKWGWVYRSATLSELTADDLEALQRLNIKTICDLRQPREATADPDKVPVGAEYLNLPIVTESRNQRRLEAMLLRPHLLNEMLRETYTQSILDESGHIYSQIFRRLADPENLPMIIHCTAGKDRTGVSIMLLLLALGVPEETVLVDYSLTNQHYDTILRFTSTRMGPFSYLGLRAEDLQPLLVADPETMLHTLAYLKVRYGSVEQYLRIKAGIDQDVLDRVKANLLEAV